MIIDKTVTHFMHVTFVNRNVNAITTYTNTGIVVRKFKVGH